MAALNYKKNPQYNENGPKPPPGGQTFGKGFKEAGFLFKSTYRYYAVFNYKKGGTLKVFDSRTGLLDVEDGGVYGRLKNGQGFSTQFHENAHNFSDNMIISDFCLVNEAYPGPVSTIALRFLGLTVFKSVFLGNMFKKAVVSLLMTGKKKIDGRAVRKFEFLDNEIVVHETIIKPKKCIEVGHKGKFKAIHMASSGYFLKQVTSSPSKPALVRFESQMQ